MTSVPFVNIRSQQQEVAAEVEPAVLELLRDAGFVGGPRVAAFEAEYARCAGARHCIGVANGTDALELALRAVGVGPGTNAVLPTNSFIATAEAVWRAGAAVTLVDAEPDHLLMDVDAAVAAVDDATAAVVPVHLYGQAAAVEEIARRVAVPLVEDAAQSQGATRWGRPTGSLGTVAATSFYPGKNLGAAGDAGAVTTDDDTVARAVRLMAAHGSERKYEHEVLGFNSRLDAVQAVVLSAKLSRLATWNAARDAAAHRYASMLGSVPDVRTPRAAPGNTHVWHLYTVRVPDRDRVAGDLAAAGIATGIHYPVPIHLTDAFAHLGHGRGDFPVAEAAAQELLSLPMFPHLTEAQQERVVTALSDSLHRGSVRSATTVVS